MLTTRFTELVGCQVQIQQAGMGQIGMPPLVAACRAEQRKGGRSDLRAARRDI